EHVAPPAGTMFGIARPPRAVLVLTVARALGDDRVAAREDPVEVREVVGDALQRRAHVAEQLADVLLAVGQSPLREVHLGVVGEQVEDAASRRCRATVVERLQILDCHRLALLVGHRLSRQCHACLRSWFGISAEGYARLIGTFDPKTATSGAGSRSVHMTAPWTLATCV